MSKGPAYGFIEEVRRTAKEGGKIAGKDVWMEGIAKTVATAYRENDEAAIRELVGALKEYRIADGVTPEEAEESALRYLDRRCAFMDRAVEGRFDGKLRAFFRRSAHYEIDLLTEIARLNALLKEEQERIEGR
jgi:hypothetical protein